METEGAMPDIGVRELKARASEIVRNVRERRARYTITYRGKPVGVLIPLEQPAPAPLTGEDGSAGVAWDELVRLGEEIGQGWQSPLTGTELLSEMRR
jgi:prevent-host-death family protein